MGTQEGGQEKDAERLLCHRSEQSPWSSANEGADRDPQVLIVRRPWAKIKYQFEQPNVLKA